MGGIFKEIFTKFIKTSNKNWSLKEALAHFADNILGET